MPKRNEMEGVLSRLHRVEERLHQVLNERARTQRNMLEGQIEALRSMQLLSATLGEMNKERLIAVEELAKTKEKLERVSNIASQDPLTGLLNRRGMKRSLHRQLSLLQRTQENLHIPFAGILIDLDKFKQVNDVCGHLEGDVVLGAIAEALSMIFHRSSDILCRLGGDEFLVLCFNTTQEQAFHLAVSLCDSVTRDERFRRQNCQPVTVSIGIAQSSIPQEVSPEEIDDLYGRLMNKADRAMYHSKEFGLGNTITITDGSAMNLHNTKKEL